MSNVFEAPKADLTAKPQVDGNITQGMIDGLLQGRKWAKFLAILGYIGAGFMGLAIIIMIIGAFSGGLGGVQTILMLLLAVFYAFFIFIMIKLSGFLRRYSHSIKELSSSHSQGDLIESQDYFRRYMKWIGVMLLISVGISVLAVIAVLVISVI